METLEQLREQDRLAAIGPGPVGLGGWLILPLLGIIMTPIMAVVGMMGMLPAIDGYQTMTAVQQLLLWFELISNLVFQGIVPIVLLVLFFRQMRSFPLVYVTWISLNMIVMLLDLIFAYHAFRDYYDSPGAVFWDTETVQTLGRSVLGVAIWVPYMMNSRRVQNTFVN